MKSNERFKFEAKIDLRPHYWIIVIVICFLVSVVITWWRLYGHSADLIYQNWFAQLFKLLGTIGLGYLLGTVLAHQVTKKRFEAVRTAWTIESYPQYTTGSRFPANGIAFNPAYKCRVVIMRRHYAVHRKKEP